LLIEGRLPETVHRRSRCGVLRLRLVTAPREVRDPARQALRLGCEELAARAAEEMPQTEARDPGQKPPRWSAERRASYVIGRRAPRKRPDVPRHGASNRVPLHSGACRRSAHPSGWGFNFKTRAQSRRGNEVCCSHGLFDIVRWKYCSGCIPAARSNGAAAGTRASSSHLPLEGGGRKH
jgi:hypothetical protein